MTCEFNEELIGGYHDGELDPVQSAEVAAHLETCPECSALLERLRDLSRTAREPALYYEAPAYLEARVRASLGESVRKSASPAPQIWRWVGIAAALALAAGLIWSVTGLRGRGAGQKQIADAVVSSHIRSLLATHLFDVPSTDRHTVKPWFDGKLDFSPDVKDLASDGFRLAGGRLDYVDGRQVAALVYQRRLHVVNLFVWPSSEAPSGPSTVAPQHGYNVVHWNAGGMAFWAVADIPSAELEQFGQLYEK
jgi:anti-sigma factor RsiW